VSRLRAVELVRVGGSYQLALSTGALVRFGDPALGSFSPMEALLAALGACTAIDVHAIATKKRQLIDRYSVRVQAEQRDEHPRVFSRIDVIHEVEGRGLDEDAIRRSIELSAGKYCPVSAILSAGPAEVHHGYLIRDGTRPSRETSGEVLVTGPGRAVDAASFEAAVGAAEVDAGAFDPAG
jgi:putative redox protein